MNRIHYVLSVAWTELQILARDRGALGILFLLPLLIGSLSSAPSAMSMRAVEAGEAAILLNVGLVNADGGTFGMEVAKAIQTIKELNVATFSTAAEGEAQVAKGEKSAVIIIPAGFSQSIETHQPTEIQVIVDPAQPESASIVSGIMNQVVSEVTVWGEVQYGISSLLNESGLLAGASPEQQRGVAAQTLGVVMTRINEVRRNPAITVMSEEKTGVKTQGAWQLGWITYTFAGFTVMFIFFITQTSAVSLLQERETGVLRRLLAAPIPSGAVIAGKMLAYLIIVCLQVILLFGVAKFVFGVPLGKSPVGLALLTLAVGLAATSLGMLLAAVSKTSRQANSLGFVLGFVLAGMGGAVAINPGMMFFQAEGFMGFLAKLTPHGHAVKGFYSLMTENATIVQILPQVLILLGMSAIFYLVARWRFKFVV